MSPCKKEIPSGYFRGRYGQLEIDLPHTCVPVQGWVDPVRWLDDLFDEHSPFNPYLSSILSKSRGSSKPPEPPISESPKSPVSPIGPVEPPPIGARDVEILTPAAASAAMEAPRDNLRCADRQRKIMLEAAAEKIKRLGRHRRYGVPVDVDQALARLQERVPNIPGLVEALELPMRAAFEVYMPVQVPPLLLVGQPGVGKSHAAQAVAEAFGVGMHTVQFAASSAYGSALCGVDAAWAGAEPGLLFRAVVAGTHANPVVLLDELDKSSRKETTRGDLRDPTAELLAALEPQTAGSLRDRCLDVEFDARYVIYVATANSVGSIPAPLLSRFRILHVEKPNAAQSLAIVRSVYSEMYLDMPELDLRPPRGEPLHFLATLNPRMMRRVLMDAYLSALTRHSSEILVKDIERAIGHRPDADKIFH